MRQRPSLGRCSHEKISPPDSTGIVIGGFGARQRYPALVAYEVEGFIGTTFKSCRTHERDLNEDSRGTLIPFAQHSTIGGFVTGIDHDAERYLFSGLINELQSCLDDTAEAFGMTLEQKNALHERLAQTAATFDENIASYKSFRIQNVRDEIDRLTATSLKALAQTLIALESARHQYAHEVPSVGGGSDLLVMRRADRNVQIDHFAAA